MGYVLILLATLAWSFVGVLVKLVSPMMDSNVISFYRFFIGVLFLGGYMLFKNRSLDLRMGFKWIWIGGAAKAGNYLLENYAITLGYSYSNILIPPVQTTAILLLSVWLLKDRVSSRGWVAAGLCMLGVLIIGWNGVPLEELMAGNGLITILFICSGIMAGLHVVSQRKLIAQLDSGSMNLSIFTISALLLAPSIPLHPSYGLISSSTLIGWAALIALGLITGLSFMWYAEGLKRVPLTAVAIMGNFQVLFTVVWSLLFFDEPITQYVFIGIAVFIAGIMFLQLPIARRR